MFSLSTSPTAPIRSVESHPGVEDADRLALTRLYESSAQGLRGYLLRLCGDPTTADDLCQESFLRMISRGDWSLPAGRQRAYLYRIATNLVRDRYRRWKRHDLWRTAQEAVAGGVRGLSREAALDMDAALSRLPRRQRALLWLAYAEGHTHAEIAEILGLRPASVRVLLHRARRKISGWLDSDDERTTSARATGRTETAPESKGGAKR